MVDYATEVRYHTYMTLHVFHDTRDSAITSPVSRSANLFHEHGYLSAASSFIAAVPYNHIEVLHHVKTRTNGPCLHARRP